MIHSKSIKGFNSFKDLAEDIGNLHYESLCELLEEISIKLDLDSIKDFKSKKYKLSESLKNASNNLKDASQNINKSWLISKPYMNY